MTDDKICSGEVVGKYAGPCPYRGNCTRYVEGFTGAGVSYFEKAPIHMISPGAGICQFYRARERVCPG